MFYLLHKKINIDKCLDIYEPVWFCANYFRKLWMDLSEIQCCCWDLLDLWMLYLINIQKGQNPVWVISLKKNKKLGSKQTTLPSEAIL